MMDELDVSSLWGDGLYIREMDTFCWSRYPEDLGINVCTKCTDKSNQSVSNRSTNQQTTECTEIQQIFFNQQHFLNTKQIQENHTV